MIQKSKDSSYSAGARIRRKRSDGRADRASWLARFERSGLGLAEFCHRHRLSVSTLLHWRREARGAATIKAGKLVEVPAAAIGVAAERGAAVTIRLPNRIELHISGCDPKWVGALVKEALTCLP
jgi:hypothetical protein